MEEETFHDKVEQWVHNEITYEELMKWYDKQNPSIFRLLVTSVYENIKAWIKLWEF